jgi:DNA-binding NarL/FixJ family response regulator
MLADLRQGPGAEEVGGPLGELTARELEVLGLIAQGLTNAGIADRLVISEHTVHRHVSNILGKLDAPTRSAASALAAQHGLVPKAP